MPLFNKQLSFMNKALNPEYRFLLYGGGVGGGKTIVSLGYADELCKRYPGIRIVVIRKTLRNIKRATWPSFETILRENGDPKRAVLHRGDAKYVYGNESEILFMGCNTEDDPELNDLRGLEVTLGIIEEANEVSEKVFGTLISRVGRWRNGTYNIPPTIICTTNPSNNWVKTLFYDPWVAGQLKPPYYFQQALPYDNPHLPQSYIENLAFMPEAEFERFAKGNWEYSDIPNQLTPYMFFKACICPTEELTGRIPKYLGIDVAREGNDKTVLCFGDDEGILFFEEYKHSKCNMTAPIVQRHITDFKMRPSNIIFDANGNGAAMEEALEALGIFATTFKGQEGPQSIPEVANYIFKNKRAEAAWLFRKDVYDENISFPFHAEFQKQALVIRYLMPENYIMIASKATIKKTLKYSPDHWEAVCMMNYARHGMGYGLVSLQGMHAAQRTAKTMLVKQSITKNFDNGELKTVSIMSVYGESMAPSLLSNASSLAY